MIDLRLAFRRNWALYPTPSGLARIACLLLVLAAFAAGHAADWVAAPSGLVGWWPGDGDARDIVGGHHGILRGGATANVEGYIGKGFSFDGTNKYVEIPNAPALNPSELSVECWVRFNNLDAPGTSAYIGQQYLVFKQNTRFGDFEAYVLSKDRTHADIILWEVTSAEGKLVRIDSTSSVGTNEWYHLVGVRGPNYIKLYFNGKLEAQAAVDFPQDYGNYPLYFGTSGQDYYDRRLNGVLDEVCLYRRVLTAQEVASLYAAGRAGKSRPAQVTVSGGGYVHPNYNRHLLKPGRVYQMTAYPAPGYVFSNWTGSVTSTKRTLSFFAQKSLALHANFVPNPFRPVAGTYRGLFYESDAARHGSSGIALLFVTSRGTFTGTLRVAGHSYPLVGRFDLEGKTSLTVRRANLGSVSLQLQLDLHQGSDRITGTVASGTWQAALTADRLVYGQSNPCPQIGRYTLAVEGSEDTAIAPGGATAASVMITRAGTILLSGVLADGLPLTRSSAISKTGQWPLYVPLYGGAGSIFGWINFEESPEADLTGTLVWTRPALDSARFYPNGFVLESQAIGSRYTRPAAEQTVLNFSHGVCELTGGNLATPITDYFDVNTKNQVSSTNGFKMEFRLASGFLNGSALDPATSKTHSFKGVVLQKANLGRGYFRGTNESGSILIRP